MEDYRVSQHGFKNDLSKVSFAMRDVLALKARSLFQRQNFVTVLAEHDFSLWPPLYTYLFQNKSLHLLSFVKSAPLQHQPTFPLEYRSIKMTRSQKPIHTSQQQSPQQQYQLSEDLLLDYPSMDDGLDIEFNLL